MFDETERVVGLVAELFSLVRLGVFEYAAKSLNLTGTKSVAKDGCS